MLGYIYVYTNIIYPSDQYCIIPSNKPLDEFINITNKKYESPINLFFYRPSLNYQELFTILTYCFKKYIVSDFIYKIKINKIKIKIIDILSFQFKKYNYSYEPKYKNYFL